MLVKLLKAIVNLVVVSLKLAYVFVFYPTSGIFSQVGPTNETVKNAENIIDPEYNPTEYGSGETSVADEALKDEWIQGNVVTTKETDYTFDPIIVESTKKILKES